MNNDGIDGSGGEKESLFERARSNCTLPKLKRYRHGQFSHLRFDFLHFYHDAFSFRIP